MAKIRAIRFSDQDSRQIEEFLRRNDYFDFSTLARMAILGFIQNPKINIQSVARSTSRSKKEKTHGTL